MNIYTLLIAVLLGVLAYLLAGLFLPHTIALLIGILVGLVCYLNNPGRAI